MGICRICGETKKGMKFDDWVADTFTNWDLLQPGDVICDGCLFWFGQRSEILADKMGKDKPQKMQNYSHFVVNGEWIPLGKGDKRSMAALLLGQSFPELAAIAVSGQKHLAFRTRRNPRGSSAGWVQFEEAQIFVEPKLLHDLLAAIEALYTGFSKGEIESGRYSSARVIKFGIWRLRNIEDAIKLERGKALFELALFLAQRDEEETDG